MKVFKMEEIKQEKIGICAGLEIKEPVKKEETSCNINFAIEKMDNYIVREVDNHIKFWATRKPVALIGNSGSGKNFAVAHYASQQGLPLLVVPCDDSQVLRELLGFWKAVDGTTIWCEGLLSQFMKIPSVILFDEVNCLPSGKLFMLHELLENRKLFIKDAPSEQAIVKLHPQVSLFLSMNPPEARYSGTNRLNTALATRAAFIVVPDFKDEEILNVKTGKEEMDNLIIQFYKEVSRIIKEQKLRITICKRNIDAIVSGIKDGLSIENAVMQGFINSALATASTVERNVLVNAAILVFGASNFGESIKEQKADSY